MSNKLKSLINIGSTRKSARDRRRKDQLSDHQRWSAVRAILGRRDPQSVGLPNAATRSRCDHQREDKRELASTEGLGKVIFDGRISESDHRRRYAGYSIRGRCDPQSVGLPNAAIHSQCDQQARISGRDHLRKDQREWYPTVIRSLCDTRMFDPQTIGSSNAAIRRQCGPRTGFVVGVTSDGALDHPDSFKPTCSTQPDSFNRTHSAGHNQTDSFNRLVQPDSLKSNQWTELIQ